MLLSERMKKYERTGNGFLVHRMPAIIRIDGRAFHTFTKGFKKPFDSVLMKIMEDTALSLVSEISTAKIAYGQSDEISILLIDYNNLETMQWFDGNISKICSIASSLATNAFNQKLYEFWREEAAKGFLNEKEAESNKDFDRENLYYEKMHKACFDARVFSIPENDVPNYFLWRRKDCIRNSIASFAQSKFSSKQLHGLNTSEMLKKMLDSGFDWDKMSWREKEGFYVYRDSFIENDVKYSKWSISGYGEESFWNPEKINELVAHKNGQRTSKI